MTLEHVHEPIWASSWVTGAQSGSSGHSGGTMVLMFNHWLSKYHVNTFSWDNLPQQVAPVWSQVSYATQYCNIDLQNHKTWYNEEKIFWEYKWRLDLLLDIYYLISNVGKVLKTKLLPFLTRCILLILFNTFIYLLCKQKLLNSLPPSQWNNETLL